MQRLEVRRPELERATLDCVYGIGNPADVPDPEYSTGLRGAVSAALFYGIGGIGPGSRTSVPPQLLAQARQAARNSVGRDSVLRRYFAGFTLLGDFLIEEAAQDGWVTSEEMKRLLRVEAGLFDRVLAAVGEEYAREVEGYSSNLESRRVERVVRGLLAGELSDPAELGYELDAWHLAAIASGPGAVEALRALVPALDSQFLLVRQDSKTAWAWFGACRKRSARSALRLSRLSCPAQASLAFGEPGEGLPGWRLSHKQALAAMPVARRGPDKIVCYADVRMLASALRDDVLSSSLREYYLVPLEQAADGGVAARTTLAAYFAANRNASSAAAALGVSRKTVSTRLRAVEEKIGRPLDRCAPELETALRLRDLI